MGSKGARRERRGRKVKRWREIEIAGTRGAESRKAGRERGKKKSVGGKEGKRHMPAGKLSVSPAPDSIIKISRYSRARALVIVRTTRTFTPFSPLALEIAVTLPVHVR